MVHVDSALPMNDPALEHAMWLEQKAKERPESADEYLARAKAYRELASRAEPISAEEKALRAIKAKVQN